VTRVSGWKLVSVDTELPLTCLRTDTKLRRVVVLAFVPWASLTRVSVLSGAGLGFLFPVVELHLVVFAAEFVSFVDLFQGLVDIVHCGDAVATPLRYVLQLGTVVSGQARLG